ncbi:sel1 repeat family protein [Vibrio sp. SCSIO 43135]|uniref:Sel1 repeat family protein n=1 Tax=Vibrio paucivorans TaxID=2829489 RepID=A0A9X3CHZ9_9VIBR|nr:MULTISPECIES: sel1 repeat family protein [Vibrio]MCW8336081.1 sel1 repeat family protein [Vibrio paucivorans]USD43068.1 sel1 repeat family protein [Vibrio sp. SCSIO 43135]
MSILARFSFIALFACTASAQTELYDEQQLSPQQAQEVGNLLRAQYKITEAFRYLKYAADLGDAKAAYLYAIELQHTPSTLRRNDDFEVYMLRSAKAGYIDAALYLYTQADWLESTEKSNWRSRYYEMVIELGASDPNQAFYRLYNYFKTSEPELANYYLKQSASNLYPLAVMATAANIANGQGTFLMPGSRETESRLMYKTAAESNFLPAIRHYILLLEQKNKREEAFEWRLKAIELGDLNSLAVAGRAYAGMSEYYSFVASDSIKAKSYLDLYLSYAGSDKLANVYANAQTLSTSLSKVMTADQIEQANIRVEEYKQSTTYYNFDYHWGV